MTAPIDQTFVSGTTISSEWLNGVNDHVNDLETTTHSSDTISYTPNGTGAVATDVQTKLHEFVSVKDFGAVGDGVTDDTAAIQAAISRFTSGSPIFLKFPAGSYLVTSKITLNKSSVFVADKATLIINTSTHAFEINNTDSTNPKFTEFDGFVFKWAGTFGTSAAGGILCTNAANLKITNNIFWGLGKSAISLTNVICGIIENNQFKEHLNNDDIIYSPGTGYIYLLTVRNNFFQFTSPGLTKSCVYLRSVFNLDLSNNAFEIGNKGVYLCQYGALTSASIKNNFFESCTTGLSLGNNNGDGYFGFLQGVAVENNVFTANTNHIVVAGSCDDATVANNSFDGGTNGINVTSKGYGALLIGSNRYKDDIALANRVIGYAYPFGTSAVDSTKYVVDRTEATASWTEQFDPSGFGTLATASPMPGVNATASLQLSYSATPTDQYIIQKTVTSIDLSNADFFVVPFYVDDPAKLMSVANQNWRVVGIGPNSSNYWGFNIGGWSDHRTAVVKKGWNVMVFPKSDAVVVTGSPASWSTITYLQLRVVPLNSSSSPVVRFGGVYGFKLNGASAFAGSQIL